MMAMRIDDMPVYAAQPNQLEASLYNPWRGEVLARMGEALKARLQTPAQ
jgi:hypothetical protein